jgi:prepilin-type N-terminal cleavage/methylation domain-containing protein
MINGMNKKFGKREIGFTLIEMAVALGIFTILITAVMRVYTNGFYSQKRALEMQALQRDGSYIFEVVSREIRMARDANISKSPVGLTNNTFSFVNHDGVNVTYCLAKKVGSSVSCNATGDSFAISMDGGANYDVINSSDVTVTRLLFTSSTDGSNADYTKSEPLITVTLSLQSKKDPGANLTLQTGVAMRLYSTHL